MPGGHAALYQYTVYQWTCISLYLSVCLSVCLTSVGPRRDGLQAVTTLAGQSTLMQRVSEPVPLAHSALGLITSPPRNNHQAPALVLQLSTQLRGTAQPVVKSAVIPCGQHSATSAAPGASAPPIRACLAAGQAGSLEGAAHEGAKLH